MRIEDDSERKEDGKVREDRQAAARKGDANVQGGLDWHGPDSE